jgi:type 2 lantibiotic biosynthesis protein LanM
MSVNARLARLAEQLFPRSSYDELVNSAVIGRYAQDAAERVRDEGGSDTEALSEAAWCDQRNSFAELIAWMLLFRVSEDRLQASVDSWVTQQCEILRRLAIDRAEIEACFGLDAGHIAALELDLSDRHNGGRTVAALTFESGLKLVYKPRDSGIESWFNSFLAGLNELGAPLHFQALRVVAREEHGWTEFAAHTRCRDEAELQRFYRNAGALLCLLHLLCATDCHFENLIASGESPLFVDAETLFQPSLTSDAEVVSVLRTGMLPRPARLLASAEVAGADFGALSAVTPQSVAVSIPGLDEAADHTATVTLAPETNLPFPYGHELNPQAYVEEMVAGFRQTWRFVEQHRDTVLLMVEGAASLNVRYVFRDTPNYYQALVASLSVGNLDAITLPALTGARLVFVPLEERERLALRQLDIPRFTLCAGDTGLDGVAKCFPLSGIELARRNLINMSDEEMEKQAGILRVSWGLYGAAKSLSQLSNK